MNDFVCLTVSSFSDKIHLYYLSFTGTLCHSRYRIRHSSHLSRILGSWLCLVFHHLSPGLYLPLFPDWTFTTRVTPSVLSDRPFFVLEPVNSGTTIYSVSFISSLLQILDLNDQRSSPFRFFFFNWFRIFPVNIRVYKLLIPLYDRNPYQSLS